MKTPHPPQSPQTPAAPSSPSEPDAQDSAAAENKESSGSSGEDRAGSGQAGSRQSGSGEADAAASAGPLARKLLLIGGLALVLLSMVYGAIYGGVYLKNVRQTRANQLLKLVALASRQAPTEELSRQAGQFEHDQEIWEELEDAHSHLALFGLIAFAVGAAMGRINLGGVWKLAMAAALLLGAVTLPAGVFWEVVGNPQAGRVVALGGGIIELLGTGLALVGFLLNSVK